MSRKHTIYTIVIVIATGVFFATVWFLLSPQEATAPVEVPPDITAHIESKSDFIVVSKPQALEVVSSPFRVRGTARGLWYFEATFPIIIVDWDGRIITESFVTAQDDWMTEEFVPFEGEITFENPAMPGIEEGHFSRRGTIIFQKANPSGLSENADALEIPIYFEIKEDNTAQ